MQSIEDYFNGVESHEFYSNKKFCGTFHRRNCIALSSLSGWKKELVAMFAHQTSAIAMIRCETSVFLELFHLDPNRQTFQLSDKKFCGATTGIQEALNAR